MTTRVTEPSACGYPTARPSTRSRDADPVGYARALANQGNTLAHLGMFDHARAKLAEARFLFEEAQEWDATASVRGLLNDLTVGETARYTASLFAGRADVPAALRRAGIAEIADRRVGKCSGGEQQRLRFAMALLSDPELLILDEPTTGMDVEGRREFWGSIRHDADRGRTVLFATHYLEEADAYADRIVLIRKGEIVADGTSAQVKSLASGRTVRATLPGATEQALRAVPGADSIEIRGETVLIHSGDADKVARYLLTETGAHDLEITSRGLEEAFLALTGDDDNTTGGNQ